MRAFFACLVLIASANPAASQDVYRPHADTSFLVLENPYRMYWVRGADTLSEPMHDLSVQAQRWESDGTMLRVFMRRWQLDVHRRVKEDTFTVSPLGVVGQINGRPPGLNDEVDLLLRLPTRSLAVGLVWSDTLQSSQRTGPGQVGLYELARSYRVGRLFDSAGMRLAEVAATGLVHYRDSWWMDSTSGTFASLDVTGPVAEHFLYAVRAGRLLDRSWSMNLTGRGTLPAANGRIDTTAAGLISSETQRTVTADQAHLLTRPLPGSDTTFSLSTGPIFLHTVLRQPQDVESGMARNDGLTGTAHARYADGRVQSYDVLWTDSAVTPRHIALAYVHDSLRIQDTGQRDTAVAIPTIWWGVADYAMGELLVPTFLAQPADGVVKGFAIFRPYPRHWDVGTASLRSIGDVFVASYRLGKDTAATYFLITKNGDLLMGQNSDPTGAQRLPPEGSARRARLEEILKTLQQRSR